MRHPKDSHTHSQYVHVHTHPLCSHTYPVYTYTHTFTHTPSMFTHHLSLLGLPFGFSTKAFVTQWELGNYPLNGPLVLWVCFDFIH